jgi:hypothetical protein
VGLRQEALDSDVTIVEAHAGSNKGQAVAGIDMEDRLDPLSQGRQSVQGGTLNHQQTRAGILELLRDREEMQQIRQL